jgi:histidyl-tRNA synthetase
MFRAERPQKGRMRQFYQMGVEAIGSYDPYLDAEIIQLMDQIVTELGLRDYEIVINSLGCGKNKNKYRKALKKYLKPYLNELCKDCQNRYKTNPLRILDCKNSKCQKIINKAPYPLDYLCDECRAHFAKVKKLLTSVGVKYTVNPRLVRGLDYYTRTTFELVHKKLGAKNTICAGGRYDTLVSDFGGPDKGACGFAFGIERLILATKEEGLEIKPEKEISVYLAVIGEEAKEQAFILTNKLRKKSILTYIDYQGKSLKAQMRQANKLNCKYVLVIGEDELKKSKFILKNMRKHSQEEINKEKIVSYLVKDIGLHKNSSDLDYRD